MMLDYLGETAAGRRVEQAMARLLSSGAVPSADTRSISTSDMGDMVVRRLREDA
jgi:isocitrate/isopropylmalate dehydrogenase